MALHGKMTVAQLLHTELGDIDHEVGKRRKSGRGSELRHSVQVGGEKREEKKGMDEHSTKLSCK